MRYYSLAFLTISELDPITAIYTAAESGYDAVGLRMLKASPIESDYPLLYDDALFVKVAEAIKETGIDIGDVELIRLKPDTDVSSFKPFFERAHILGARHVIVAGDDDKFHRITENFTMLCELAFSYGMTADLEPMPWTKVPNIKTALQIVESAGMSNGGILVDALHFHRSGDTFDAIRAIPPERIHIFQICDAPILFDSSPTALVHTARANRLFPGYGEIDLKGILSCIPDSAIISVEVPNLKMAQIVPAQERARCALHAAKKILSTIHTT